MSQHLAKLRLVGAVRTRREGNRIFYAAENEHIERLASEALLQADHLVTGGRHHAKRRSGCHTTTTTTLTTRRTRSTTRVEGSERGVHAVKVSFVALMLTALVQVAMVVLTGSVGLLADTIHNFADVVTAVPLFVAFRLGRRPSNRRYTYGYHRAEDLAGVFVILMITLSAVIAGWEAITRLIHPQRVSHVGILFVAGVVGFFGNELVALYRTREGTRRLAVLVADGYHARTDGFTSLAVAREPSACGLASNELTPSSVSASRSRSSSCCAVLPGRSTTGSWTRSTPRSSIASRQPLRPHLASSQ